MTPAQRKAAGWPRLLAEVAGLRVRLSRNVHTGMVEVPAGALGYVRAAGNGWDLLQFLGDPCPCCKVKAKITRLSPSDMEIIPGAARPR